MEILFFLQQRELSPSPPSCSEPERLAEKTWSLVGEFYLQLFITGLWSVSFHSFAWVGLGLVWFGLAGKVEFGRSLRSPVNKPLRAPLGLDQKASPSCFGCFANSFLFFDDSACTAGTSLFQSP